MGVCVVRLKVQVDTLGLETEVLSSSEEREHIYTQINNLSCLDDH